MRNLQRHKPGPTAGVFLPRQEPRIIETMSRLEREARSFVDILKWRGRKQPDRRAFTFLLDGEIDEIGISYQELDRQARAIAALLQCFAAPGERALLIYPPGLSYIAGFFGCLYAGVVAVPAYPPDPVRLDRTLPRLQAILDDSQATVVLTTSPILALAEVLFNRAPNLGALQWMATDTVTGGVEYGWQEPPLEAGDLALLQYTSGTTRTPRGVKVTHGNLLHNARLIEQAFGAGAPGSGVLWLPPYHDMGLIGGLLQPVYQGIHCALMSPMSFLQRPVRWLEAISRYRGRVSGGPNFAYELCIRKVTAEQKARLDLSCWEVAFNGGERVRAETLERFSEAFAPCGFRREAFFPCYGLAEATLFVAGAPLQKKSAPSGGRPTGLQSQAGPIRSSLQENPPVSCGPGPASQRVLIVDPQTRRPVPEGCPGEIWLSGPSVARGYWNHEAESEAVFDAYLADSGAGPFLRSGDLGIIQAGELYVTGRLKDLLIIEGSNYYPDDIEASVEGCHPDLRPGGCAAFSVEANHQEKLVVVAEYSGNNGGCSGFQAEQVRMEIAAAVAARHELRPYDILLVRPRSLPKTSSGKLQRHLCKERYLERTLDCWTEMTPFPAPGVR